MRKRFFNLYREGGGKLLIVDTATGEVFYGFFGVWLPSAYTKQQVKEKATLIGKNLRTK